MTKKTKITPAARAKCLNTSIKLTWRTSREPDTQGLPMLILSTPLGYYRAAGYNRELYSWVLSEFLMDFLTDDEKEAAKAAGCSGISRNTQGTFVISDFWGIDNLKRIAKAAGYNLQNIITYYKTRKINVVTGYKILKL